MSRQNTEKKSIVTKWWIIALIISILLLIIAVSNLKSNYEKAKASPVTDPQVLSYLWDEYIFDAIHTIANQPFASSQQVNRDYAVQYAVWTMCRKGIYESLDNGWGRIDPATMQEWIDQYLNTSITDIIPSRDFTFTGFYNSEKDAFCVNDMFSTGSRNKFNETNPWGIKLDSVIRNQHQKTYTINLLQYASAQSRRITRQTVCVLQERPDGTMYFVNITDSYPVQKDLIKISGDYEELDPAVFKASTENNDWPMQLLKHHNGMLFIRTENGQPGSKYQNCIMVCNDRSFKEITRFESSAQFLDVKTTPTGYLILSRDSIIKLSSDAMIVEENNIPPTVQQEAMHDDWWGGLDVSKDGRYLVYSSQSQGLMLYDTKAETTMRLAGHLPRQPENSQFEYVPLIVSPAFVDNDNKVVSKILGYESIGGYIIIDLETKQSQVLSMSDFTYNNIYAFSSDLPAAYGISSRPVDPSNPEHQEIYVSKLDYAGINITHHPAILTDDNQEKPLSPETWPLIMQSPQYLAYVAAVYNSTGDNADNMYYIVRIDLESMKAETLLTIKAGYPSLLGMLEDGRVIFSYYFENASGLGITAK